jgi:hypothetical protein
MGLECTIFGLVPLFILLFYGIEDKNAWFFGHEYINDYRYRIQGNVVNHVGVMISHYSLVVIISIVAILISWIGYYAWRLVQISYNSNATVFITH